MASGMPVLEQGSPAVLGKIAGILLHPDQGKVEGFFVRLDGFWRKDELFLASSDIRHWGTQVRVRDADALSPLEDRIRLLSLIEDGRTLLGQPILTETGRHLGTCRDVQFETLTFMVEWLFPKRFFRWGTAVQASAIVQVRPDAIIVRDPTVTETSKPMEVLRKLDRLAEAPSPVPRPLDA